MGTLLFYDLPNSLGFPGGSVVRNLPAKQETRVQSLGQEDPLEKEMATYSSILAWRIPWTEEPGRLQSMGLQRVKHDLVTEQQQQDVYTVGGGIYFHSHLVNVCNLYCRVVLRNMAIRPSALQHLASFLSPIIS